MVGALAAFGVVLLVAPGSSADHFAWPIGAFLASTMGAWYLGSALMGAMALRDWRWARCRPALIYLWLFSLGQAAVLVWHGENADALAIAHAVVLGIAVVGTLVGIAAWQRTRPFVTTSAGRDVPWWWRTLLVAFVVLTVALVALTVDGIQPDGRVWPGPLALASAQAFAAFFGALALSGAVAVIGRRTGSAESWLIGGTALSGIITIVTLGYIDEFDYDEHPGGAVYLGLYIVAAIVAPALLVWARGSRRRQVGA